MKKIIFTIFLLNCLLIELKAQDQKYIDSLLTASKSGVDSVRFRAYSFLSWNLKETNKSEAVRFSKLLLKEATEKNNKKWIARSLSDLSVIYEYSGDLNKAMDYAEQALSATKLTHNKKDVAGALFNLASIKSKNNQLADALEFQLEALKIYEKLKKDYYIAVCCNAIGMSYSNIGNLKQSNFYLQRALELSNQRGDLYISTMTMGIMADNFKILNQIDSSIFYYKLVIKAFEEMEDYTNYAAASNNLGEIYFEQGKIEQSKNEYSKALKVSQEMQDTGAIALYEANLAKTFIKQGNYNEAEKLLLNSLVIAEKMGNGEVEIMAYEYLMNLYMHKKDFLKSEFYFKKYNHLKDTMFSKETALRFSEAQTKFDVEKKDLEIEKNKVELDLARQERAKKNITIGLIVTLLLATVFSSLFFYRKKQVQNKANLAAELAKQKEIRSKAIIDAEEKERRRIAQDLHDGIGQILSAAKLNLSSLESTLKTDNSEQKEAFKNTLSLIDDSVKEVRTVSHNMMPNTLIKLGLASAVKEFITKIGSLPNLKIDLEIVGLDLRLDESTETAIYRAIQEIVNNIVKHAKANKISIQLIRHQKEISIVVEDNGIGFDTQKINEFEGIGLKNIFSRIEFINGKVHFDSQPGKGTTVLMDIPV